MARPCYLPRKILTLATHNGRHASCAKFPDAWACSYSIQTGWHVPTTPHPALSHRRTYSLGMHITAHKATQEDYWLEICCKGTTRHHPTPHYLQTSSVLTLCLTTMHQKRCLIREGLLVNAYVECHSWLP